VLPIFAANVVFRSFFGLQAVIRSFVARSNDIPKSFVWAADPANSRAIAAVTTF
jgi:hypothetical protein